MLVRGGLGSVTDPFVSFDGQWCYYSYFPNLQRDELNFQRADLPYQGADIYRIHLKTRVVEPLTFQEFTPNTAAGKWTSDPVNPPAQFNRLGYGILNLGPCPLPGGKVAFTSNRNGYEPPKGYTAPTLQLFVMDEDGENVTCIAPMNIGSALHPTPLRDGRIMFSSYESQGLRDQRMWGIWSIYPDGRYWNPVVSAFHSGQAFHFMTQLGNGDLVVVDYYNLNNNGFGTLYRMPVKPPKGEPAFHGAFPDENPAIDQTVGAGFHYPFRMAFTPRGMYSITPFTTGQDEAAPVGANGVRVGKFTHPSAAPGNDLLVVWTPGPANDLDRPTTKPRYDAGLYLIRGGNTITKPGELVPIKNDPNYNEAWPRAVVPYRAVHGVDAPAQIPWLPNDGSVHPDLPRGTPYGLIGTSSFYKRESFPGFVPSWSDTFDGLDAFNTGENGQSSNWEYQGSDAGKYSNNDIFAVRILAMEPNTHRSYGPHNGRQFVSHANERLRILGEIPLRKFNQDGSPVLDPEGNPDTSFMARIPADTPFTFQTLDKDGLVLNMAQTWHQVRPGEVRNDCGGCHAHSQKPLDIANTFAGRPDYKPIDLTAYVSLLAKDNTGATVAKTNSAGAVNVEFLRDIRPVLQRSCVPCHTSANPDNASLVLDDLKSYESDNYLRVPGDYARLADDDAARWGYKPVIPNKTWRQTNASRYVRMFQSRRSLLIWKIFGRRLDGWTNADHPTEKAPGNATTLPRGADPNAADLDYTGTIMPPPNSGVPPLSEDEKMMLARWVDLGCPINSGQLGGGGNGDFGWFLDDLRPTLTVGSPRQNANTQPVTEIRVGMADAYSGINAASLSVKAEFPVNGFPPGTELAGQGSFVERGVFSIPLRDPLTRLSANRIMASVADHQGNRNTVTVRFWVEQPGPRILSVDASQRHEHRVTVRIQDTAETTEHIILCSDNLANPVASWMPATTIGSAVETGQVRRLELRLPDRFDQQCFLLVRRP